MLDALATFGGTIFANDMEQRKVSQGITDGSVTVDSDVAECVAGDAARRPEHRLPECDLVAVGMPAITDEPAGSRDELHFVDMVSAA